MEKILKKYTTIPQHLYVKREADNQLKRIIDEMERPGYVLVARQMGKTNLLLNAIREYKNENNLFAYVDLSNNFKEERECYRNIVDKIIEPNEELFSPISAEISANREKKALSPHKEYEKELRQILSIFKGKLIIILDEIDALRSVDYSDNIFAQIRSNYFARTNFPEFNNLTYVLSGVIEPTELIKDKNKSPFNIGEKIYLDDFTFKEHESFIEKSELKISKEISEEIYSWTNGNPRITFDICSEIEDLQLKGEKTTIEHLENIINNKYFIHFDIAPIDHIRDIVTENESIRKAVQNIKKGVLIDNVEIKRKLYLYGIVNSNLDLDKLQIKNKIIDKSLSSSWLESIEKESVDLFSLAIEKYDTNEYEEAIILFEEYLNTRNVPKLNLDISKYNIGFSYYRLRKYSEAIKTLESHQYDKNQLYYNSSKSILGTSHIASGNSIIGIELLKEVIDSDAVGFALNNALLNLGNYYFTQKEYPKSIELLDKIINQIGTDGESNNHKIKVIAHTTKAQVLSELKQDKDALIQVNFAIALADNSDKLELEYYAYILGDKVDKNRFINVCRIIIDEKVQFNLKEQHDFSFTEVNLRRYLYELILLDEVGLFNELLDYTNEFLINENSKAEIVFSLINFSSDNNNTNKILDYILSKEELLTDDHIAMVVYRHRAILEINRGVYFEELLNKYLNYFRILNEKIHINDISLIAHGAKYYSDKLRIDNAIEICLLISKKLINLSDELLYETIIIYYWLSNLYFTKRDNLNAVYYANKTIDIIKKFEGKRGSLIDEKGIRTILEQVVQIRNSSSLPKPMIRLTKKYGRNDKVKVKYNDNSIKEGKYKNFEADIIAERCSIID